MITAEDWHARRRAAVDAKLAEYQVPHLLELVKSELEKFTGNADFMFGVAVHARLAFYRRTCGMPYPRAAEAAYAITLHHSRGTRIA